MRLWSRSSLSSSWSNVFRMASRSGQLKNWSTLSHLAHHTPKTSHFNRHTWTPLPLLHHPLSPKTPNHHKAARCRAQTPARSTAQSATVRTTSPLLYKSCHLLLSDGYDKASGIYKIFQWRYACRSKGYSSCTKVGSHPAQLWCYPYIYPLRFLQSSEIYGRIHMAYCNAFIFFSILRATCVWQISGSLISLCVSGASDIDFS